MGDAAAAHEPHEPVPDVCHVGHVGDGRVGIDADADSADVDESVWRGARDAVGGERRRGAGRDSDDALFDVPRVHCVVDAVARYFGVAVRVEALLAIDC